jgi:hypothetical protein
VNPESSGLSWKATGPVGHHQVLVGGTQVAELDGQATHHTVALLQPETEITVVALPSNASMESERETLLVIKPGRDGFARLALPARVWVAGLSAEGWTACAAVKRWAKPVDGNFSDACMWDGDQVPCGDHIATEPSSGVYPPHAIHVLQPYTVRSIQLAPKTGLFLYPGSALLLLRPSNIIPACPTISLPTGTACRKEDEPPLIDSLSLADAVRTESCGMPIGSEHSFPALAAAVPPWLRPGVADRHRPPARQSLPPRQQRPS